MSASDELYDRRDKGWFHIDHALIEAYGPRVGAIGIAVYTYLVHKADRAGVAWPSYNTIAAALSLSRPTAIKTIRELAACGLIRVEVVRPAGKRAHNVYTLVTIGKGDLPVNDVYQSGIGKVDLLVKDVSLIGKADLPVLVKHVDPIKNHESITKEQDLGIAQAVKPRRAPARASPIAQPFEVTEEMHEWAGGLGFDTETVNRESLKFVNHYLGNGRTMKDWRATWENWLLRAQENKTQGRWTGRRS